MEETEFLREYQPCLLTQMTKMMEHEHLAHAYLFEGDEGTGKHELSMWLAKRMFCEQIQDGNPCDQCLQCMRIDQNEHPNVQVIKPDGQTIKVDQIRQLQAEFSKTGFETRDQCFIIRQADTMSSSAANSLLKFLEEPPGSFVAILETNSLGKVLPTIQSRCQLIHFSPLSKAHLIEKLHATGISEKTAALLAQLTNSFSKAVEISEDEWFNESKEIAKKWLDQLSAKTPDAFLFVQKQLVPLAKEKHQQLMLLKIIQGYYEEAFQTGKISYQEIECLLQAQRKIQANVSFQNSMEQFALRVVSS
ncbi:DNA polymerase III subunit delta' [Enterococcus bulliens]